jgi:predicted  nucleic acid-binding Zn-ribbon protein
MTEPLGQLLVVQDLDTLIDQLQHRRRTLPERAELAARERSLSELDAAIADASSRQQELERAQRRLDDEIAIVATKTKEVDRTLYSGTVSAPRELLALQDEIGALGRRQRSLEDSALELMVQQEPVDAELARLEARRAATDAEAEALRGAIAAAEAEVDGELAEVEARREAAVESLVPDLVAEYEQLRGRLGGTGVARLVGSNCGGCHLTLPAVEIDRIRHGRAGDRVHCSECGRLLVTG